MATKDWKTTKDTSNLDTWYKKQDKKGKTRESEYSSTKSGGKSWLPKMSPVF